MLLPDSMELRICVPFNSRSTAWASFDGRGRVELKRQYILALFVLFFILYRIEGDHIKITASKFPFPTICADNQSTDWFQAISRTLKWNERERQKSFVVVEEDGPVKSKKKRSKPADSQPRPVDLPEAVEELIEDEDDSDEEEDKFDIDDSSPEAAAAASALATQQTAQEEALGREKAQELIADDRLHRLAASALKKERSRSAKSRSRSGTRTADRRQAHVEFDLGGSTKDSSASDSGVTDDQVGARDHINVPRSMSGKSRIPKDRDLDADTVKTPTVANLVYGRGRGHSRTRSAENGHRAFAVWGHDESDSNASDSDT